jgi:predicted RNase H-like HicB family nuclease
VETLELALDREDDGRWLAEIPALPGVMAYGRTRDDAIKATQALALKVIGDSLEHGEAVPPAFKISLFLSQRTMSAWPITKAMRKRAHFELSLRRTTGLLGGWDRRFESPLLQQRGTANRWFVVPSSNGLHASSKPSPNFSGYSETAGTLFASGPVSKKEKKAGAGSKSIKARILWTRS